MEAEQKSGVIVPMKLKKEQDIQHFFKIMSNFKYPLLENAAG